MRIGVGWILGTVAGVIVGFAIGLSSLARASASPHLGVVSDSEIALLPLLICGSGSARSRKIATIALGVFFSTAISVYTASTMCRAT